MESENEEESHGSPERTPEPSKNGNAIEKEIIPSAPCIMEESVPLAPITPTVVTQNGNTSQGVETRWESKVFSPEQAQALGKSLGLLMRETAVGWMAKVAAIPNLVVGDMAALVRECVRPEEYLGLPVEIQAANLQTPIQLYTGLYQFFYSRSSLIGRFYSEQQKA